MKKVCVIGGGRMGLMRYQQLINNGNVHVTCVVDFEFMRDKIEKSGTIFRAVL